MPATTVPGAASAPELDAYLAVPAVGTGPWPGVVVLHEVFGLNDDTRQQADRLAAAGYLALAPDLFSAGGVLRCLRSTFSALSSGTGAAYGDIEASRALLAGREDCTGKVGVIGFCLGGGFALMAASRGFDASAPNYGPLPSDPHEVLRGACPVVASFGKRDVGLRGAAARLDAVLTEVGVEHDVKEYAGAGHSFLEPAQRRGAVGARAGGRLPLPPALGGGRLGADPAVLRHAPRLRSGADGRLAGEQHAGLAAAAAVGDVDARVVVHDPQDLAGADQLAARASRAEHVEHRLSPLRRPGHPSVDTTVGRLEAER